MKAKLQKKLFYGLLGLVVGLGAEFGTTVAHADDSGLGGSSINAGMVSLGGRAMYYIPQDADKGTLYGGAQLRIHFNQALAVEGSADYRRDDFGPTVVHVYPVQASALFYLIPNSPINVFLLAGAGWYYTTVDSPDGTSNTQNRFGPHAGAGVEWYMNKYWSIDGTYRYIWLKQIDSDSPALEAHYRDSGNMITLGLNYHF